MKKKILVIAAHADDEALGCGGVMARHAAEGCKVHTIFLADGVISRKNANLQNVQTRQKAAKSAMKILGVSSFHFLGFPDNQMDRIPQLEIVQKIEGIIKTIKPNIIYTHFHGDLNIDHKITHQAVMTVFRPQPTQSAKEIYGFEVLSSTDWNTPQYEPFLPTHFANIEKYLRKKLKALGAYQKEMRASPHSRSKKHVEYLARHRGHCMGLKAAEAFVVYRQIR